MAGSPEARSGSIAWSGKMPFDLQFGDIIASGAGVVNGVEGVCPCDGVIKAVVVRITEAGGAATALVNMTNEGVEIITDYDINAHPLGVFDLVEQISAANLKVKRGDRLNMNIENTAAGEFNACVVVFPE